MHATIPIVLLGQKDHGKSTLIGRLLVDTGSVRQQKLHELQQLSRAPGGSWELAHLVDSFREEREDGMTFDTTHVLVKGSRRVYELIDVPGHGERLAQMVSGACRATSALLLVSAQEGIQEQTSQHMEVARLIGIEQVIVVINKMDAVGFQRSIFEQLAAETRSFLKRLGYEHVPAVPISALTGENVSTPATPMSWYDGPPLLSLLEQVAEPHHALDHPPLRFVVQDTYHQGTEILVIGKVESGCLRVGQELLFVPGRHHARVTQLRDAEHVLQEVSAGHNVGVRLEPSASIARGMVGAPPTSLPSVGETIGAKLLWLAPPASTTLTIECGMAQCEGALGDSPPIQLGRALDATLRLRAPVACDPGSPSPLGKLVVKEAGRIIGVGSIQSCGTPR